MGRSVFTGPREFAVTFSSGVYKVMTKDSVFRYGDPGITEKMPEQYLTKLKAYIQYYNNSLIDNSLHRNGFCFKRK